MAKASSACGFGLEGAVEQALVGPPPHAFRSRWKARGHAGIAAEALPDLVGAAEGAVPHVFALAGMGEPVTMPAQEIAPGQVQLGDTPPAGDTVHDAGTDEKGPRAAEATGDADDADGLGHVLPVAATDAYPVGELSRSASARRLIDATRSPSRVHCQPPTQPARRQPSRCSRFTSSERHASTVSRPEPLGRPDPRPPITFAPVFPEIVWQVRLSGDRPAAISPDGRHYNANKLRF